jgi:hypothetical protein
MDDMTTAPAGKVARKPDAVSEPDELKNERLFSRIGLFSVALGFGAEFATIQSLGMNPANLSFHFSVGTLLSFLVGAAVGAGIWTIVSSDRHTRPTLGQRVFGILVIVGSVLGFLYPLRFLSHQRLIETLEGLTVVALVLSSAGFLLWRIGRFLESDEAREERQGH